MSAPRRDRLLALIAEWEDIGPDGGMRHLGPASIYRECAERLKAALRAAPEADMDNTSHYRQAAHLLRQLWGDPEDCESCGLNEEAPCEIHRNRDLMLWLQHDAGLFHARAVAPEEP